MKPLNFPLKNLTVAVLAASAAMFQPWAAAQSSADSAVQGTPAGPAATTPGDAKAHKPGMSGMDMKGTQNGTQKGTQNGMDMQAMQQKQREMMDSMPKSGSPDIDFARMMRMHHQGGIHMAETELRDGKDPQMKKLAQAMISAQKKEMAELDKFLAKNGHGAGMSGH